MKHKRKIISGVLALTSLVSGYVISNNDINIVDAAEKVEQGLYSKLTTSEDGTTRTWDFTSRDSSITKDVDLNGLTDNYIYFTSNSSKKISSKKSSSYLYMYKDYDSTVYLPVPNNSSGSVTFNLKDQSFSAGRYCSLLINGTASTDTSTTRIGGVKGGTATASATFTSSDITTYNGNQYLVYINDGTSDVKPTSISITLTSGSYGASVVATGITNNETNSIINVTPGVDYTLNYSITTATGEATTEKSLWTSSDETIATVNDGVISAVSAGDTTITLTVGSVSYTWNIHIDPVSATSISLDVATKDCLVNDEFTLTPTLEPSNATDEVIWESDDETIATVSDGVVKCISVGNATITARVNESIFATCEVSVSYISSESITLDNSEINVAVNGSQTLNATVTPSNSQDAITWESEDETIATVNNGVVTGISEGETTIKAISGNCQATCVVKVSYKSSDSVSLNTNFLSLRVNEISKLTATILPDDSNDAALFTSSNPSIVSVDESGYVRGLKEGSATITVTAGNVTDTCEVVVASKGTLNYSTNTDTLPTTGSQFVYLNGYSMYYGKAVSKSNTFEGTSYSTGIQVKSISFITESSGKIKAFLTQTGKNKNRDIQLIDENGNVLFSTHLPSTQEAYVYEVNIEKAGLYTLYIKDYDSESDTEGMINLFAISFIETEKEHIISLYQTKTNEDSTKSIRLVGGIDSSIDLYEVESFGFEVDGQMYTTNVALTELNYSDGKVLPSEYECSYFFTYIFDNVTEVSFRSFVTFKDGTTKYSSTETKKITLN